jgi:hypothetical protein
MKQYQSPFKFRRQKSVLFVCDETDGETQREREKKRNQAFTIKSQALLYSSFPRCSKSKEHNLGLTVFASLSLSQKMCVGCVGVHRRKKERKKEGFFFTSKTLNVNSHQKKFTLFSLLFSSTVFILSGRLSSWISLSLSLSSTQTTQTTTSAVFGGGGGFTRVVFVFYCCCC